MLPPFPSAPFNTTCTFLLNKGPALDGFLQKFRASGILPENETEELLARYKCGGLLASRSGSAYSRKTRYSARRASTGFTEAALRAGK